MFTAKTAKKYLNNRTVIHWFRQDLRLADNPALLAGAQQGTVVPIYILDDENAGAHAMGAASRCWLHHSLTSLNKSLDGQLQVYKGDPATILDQLIEQHGVSTLTWNRCYEPWRIARDQQIKKDLVDKGLEVKTYNGSLLWEPWEVLKPDMTPYKVFTPFFRKAYASALSPRLPLSKPENLNLQTKPDGTTSIDDLELLPVKRWDESVLSHWYIGERAAQNKLEHFIENGMSDYKKGRDFPAQKSVSQLSPYLHFGELSPNQAWYAAQASGDNDNVHHFMRELAWREFSHSLLYHFPGLPSENLQAKFDDFAWLQDSQLLTRWQTGQTGHPLVDAGMRELWQTGYMHNRVRMIVGSFLVKNLLLDWRLGASWFWDCLFDADLANNSASWQWVAGCGADAAPYFRVFNPCTQGQKFDPDGSYTRRFVPELKNLPNKYLFCPWEASKEVLRKANIELGVSYPEPVVDLKQSREQALAAYQNMKQQIG